MAQIAFMTSQAGVENVELQGPWQAVTEAGHNPVLLAPQQSTVQSVRGDLDKDATFSADLAISDARSADYTMLVIPGGTVNADRLRLDRQAVSLVQAFVGARQPIAAICHGPWMLVEAGVLPGKTLTSFPSLHTDVQNAGGTWVDEQVKHCTAEGWQLVTSRGPDDVDAFNAKITELLAA